MENLPSYPPTSGDVQFFSPPPDYRAPISKNANIVGIVLLVQVIVGALISLLLGATSAIWSPYSNDPTSPVLELITIFAYSVPFIVSISVGMYLLKIPPQVAFPTRKPKADVLICSIGISLGASFLGQLLQSFLAQTIENVFGQTPIAPDFLAPRGFLPNALYFINMAILPAILEEAMFRGIIMQSLRRYGDSFALIVSAILFGVAHGNFVQMPYTLFLGLILGYFVLHTGSIWPGVVLHFVNNGLAVLVDWISRSNTASQDLMLANVYFYFRIIAGIVCLIVLRSRLGSLFYIPRSKYPVKEKDKYTSFFSSAFIIIVLIYYVTVFVRYLQPLGGGIAT